MRAIAPKYPSSGHRGSLSAIAGEEIARERGRASSAIVLILVIVILVFDC
jgi:hypothetical protein